MRIDEIEQPVKHTKVLGLYYTFKFFYRALAAFYVQKFINTGLVFLKQSEYESVKECRQQMKPWQM